MSKIIWLLALFGLLLATHAHSHGNNDHPPKKHSTPNKPQPGPKSVDNKPQPGPDKSEPIANKKQLGPNKPNPKLVVQGARGVVAYDSRSLIINGTRELIFAGSIHYPRSTPEMWPFIIRQAKEGGLNLISTYVFWNIHEPIEGQFNFEGNNDLVKFIRLIGQSGMWVTLRIGPYIESEWNLGGFPYWLKEVPDIIFRSYNEPFMHHMKRYTEMIVNMMKEEKLFADQGGPIILAQIENEYNNVQQAYRQNGEKYIHWAAEMAVKAHNGVPWIMCKQKNAPQAVIGTCNGRQCGDTFPGAGPNKPTMWTENWTAQYRVFGDSPSQRSAEDIAFSVARFFARNGTYNNYYMYHGGTNFGRTSSSFVTPRYYDEAPLDEYGLRREPKFGHLRDLHRALTLCKESLLLGTPKIVKISQDLEITTYENPAEKLCAAFLTNNHTKQGLSIKFRGVEHFLPPRSISILPHCKKVAFNTYTVAAQHSAREYVPAKNAKLSKWQIFREKVPNMEELEEKNNGPKEMYTFVKDRSDYAWYSTNVNLQRMDLPMRPDISPVLEVANLGHALMAFVNGQFVGFGHGSNIEKSHVLKSSITLKPGVNTISLLSMTLGLPNSGAYMEKRFAGPRGITVAGLMAGNIDISDQEWSQSVGIFGEKEQIFTEAGSKKVKWVPMGAPGPLTWYKTHFDEPEGTNPVAVRMTGMGKGMIWVNGKSLGRYWTTYLSALKQPTQIEYHIPRSFLKPKGNLLVVFEEIGAGNPDKVEILTVNRDKLCSILTESDFAPLEAFENAKFRPKSDQVRAANINCPDNKFISKVEFVGYGEVDGACGHFKPPGKCDSKKARKVVESTCLGRRQCIVPFERELLADDEDACPTIPKTLAIQVRCTAK